MEPNCTKEEGKKRKLEQINMGERERESTESLTENTVVVNAQWWTIAEKLLLLLLLILPLRLRKASRIGCEKLVCGVCETQEPLAMADGGRARGGGRGRRTEKRKRHGPTDLTNDGDGRTDGEERIDDRGGGRADGQMEGREGDRQLPGLFTSIHNFFILTWEPFLTYPACLSFLSSCPHLASSLSFSSPR